MISSMFCSSVGPADFTVVDESPPPEHCTFCFPPAYPRRSHSSIQFITVKPLMFACPLFREPNKTAKLKGANINCSVRENVCNNSKIRKKSYFLDFSKKTSKKRTYNVSWLFNVYCSSSLLSEPDTVPTRCSAMAQNGSHSRI